MNNTERVRRLMRRAQKDPEYANLTGKYRELELAVEKMALCLLSSRICYGRLFVLRRR